MDVLLCDLRSLGDTPLQTLNALAEQTGAVVRLVIYDYLSVSEIQSFNLHGVKLLRGPVRTPLMLQVIQDYYELATLKEGFGRDPVPAAANEEPGKPIFSQEALARLQDIKSSITCECPSQLSSIVSVLIAFEDYSRGCENKNEADSLLHARLAQQTSTVRAVMERLLVDVCRHEQISI